ncbi:hypothetical protein LNP18_06470 [Leuconostoc citreum]|uniref:hypothetical protein n=1 Tax=Leuconostoc citreum TaxID=33964 RepID=UPI00200AED0D|nr:hypothetical protein [Leuconostoc citreum]MCK8605748.1 hypothetical protein [Leuconostoc citreum]
MTRIIKFFALMASSIACLDVLLMIINGTMFYVLMTLGGFYIILSLAFKKELFGVLKRWINAGDSMISDHDEQAKFAGRH